MEREFVLPTSVVGPADVRHMVREIEELDEFLRQAAIRKTGSRGKPPKTTEGLEELASTNRLNLLLPSDRQRVAEVLKKLDQQAPVVHLSFATDPSPAFTGKIVTWLRANIHPWLLVHIGLQPSIAAGCTVRTTNKYFDFSMRQHLLQNRHLLTNALAQLDKTQQSPQPATPLAPGGQQ